MDRQVLHRQEDMESQQDRRAMIVAVVTECRAMPAVQAMDSVEVTEVVQVQLFTVLFN